MLNSHIRDKIMVTMVNCSVIPCRTVSMVVISDCNCTIYSLFLLAVCHSSNSSWNSVILLVVFCIWREIPKWSDHMIHRYLPVGYLLVPVDLQIPNVHVSMLWDVLDPIISYRTDALTYKLHTSSMQKQHVIWLVTTVIIILRMWLLFNNIVFMEILFSYKYGLPIPRKAFGQPRPVSTCATSSYTLIVLPKNI